ncbi:MAG: hypothetical protein AAF939_01060 [Planctomycetota bacterium]
MTTIDQFFAHAGDPTVELSHPRVAEVKKEIDKGAKFQVEVYRPKEMVGLVRSKVFISTVGEVDALSTECEWSDDLNTGLIRLGVRAKNYGNESLRFALGLRDALLKVERQVGNGYFNAVLLDLVKESKLDQYPEIRDVLKFTYHDGVERTKRYHECRDAIAFRISGRARELTQNLKYSEKEAKGILSKAIAEYVDNRFAVSSRRQMGLL